MQYKIPVQIENEDPIFLGLSLRQLAIIMVGGGIAYGIFQTLAPQTGWEIALLPSWVVAAISIAIAIFKYNEMTFIPFVLSVIRINIFPRDRTWQSGTDSFWSLDVWFLTNEVEVKQETVNLQEKIDSLDELQDKLKNI